MTKEEFLKSHGWRTQWTEDDWFDITETFTERGGITTDQAYAIELRRERQREFDREHGLPVRKFYR